ncbi:MAG: SiaB family protein kinase [Salibacteraceae bacterium]
MHSPAIDNFESTMRSGEVVHSFEGEINADVLNSILKDVESYLDRDEENFKKTRKVYNVLVETLQNLYHHTEKANGSTLPNGDSQRKVKFALVKTEGDYHILAANYILADKAPTLKNRIDKINGLDKEGLRELYKEVLDNGQYSVHGGGGLGMIDIARKSGNKLDYEFTPVGDGYELFVLKIKV